jgi:hypothetical protein
MNQIETGLSADRPPGYNLTARGMPVPSDRPGAVSSQTPGIDASQAGHFPAAFMRFSST